MEKELLNKLEDLIEKHGITIVLNGGVLIMAEAISMDDTTKNFVVKIYNDNMEESLNTFRRLKRIINISK